MPALQPIVVQVECIIMGPFVSFWKHPIWWWKMRHLRADIKVMTEAVDPEFARKFDEELEHAILFGRGN